jgi:hypothetical protein
MSGDGVFFIGEPVPIAFGAAVSAARENDKEPDMKFDSEKPLPAELVAKVKAEWQREREQRAARNRAIITAVAAERQRAKPESYLERLRREYGRRHFSQRDVTFKSFKRAAGGSAAAADMGEDFDGEETGVTIQDTTMNQKLIERARRALNLDDDALFEEILLALVERVEEVA